MTINADAVDATADQFRRLLAVANQLAPQPKTRDGVMPIDLTNARAITLHNPWAHLIAHGTKRVENRSWMPYDNIHQLLIHAGKKWINGGHDLLKSYAPDDCVDTSAIVAVADLTHACNTSRWQPTITCNCGPWAQPGQCHWQLTNIHALPEPVPATGRQGLWRPDPAVLAAVQQQLTAGDQQ